jgi:hypothetical protein
MNQINPINPVNHPVYYRDLSSTHSLKLSNGSKEEPSLCFDKNKKTGLFKDEKESMNFVVNSDPKLSLNSKWTELNHFSEGSFVPAYDNNINPNKPSKIHWQRINDKVNLTVSCNINNQTGEPVSFYTIHNLPLEIRPSKPQVSLVQSSSLKGEFSGLSRVIVCDNKITVVVEAIDLGKTSAIPSLSSFQLGPSTISYLVGDF